MAVSDGGTAATYMEMVKEPELSVGKQVSDFVRRKPHAFDDPEHLLGEIYEQIETVAAESEYGRDFVFKVNIGDEVFSYEDDLEDLQELDVPLEEMEFEVVPMAEALIDERPVHAMFTYRPAVKETEHSYAGSITRKKDARIKAYLSFDESTRLQERLAYKNALEQLGFETVDDGERENTGDTTPSHLPPPP